ncbi:MAG: glutamate racemase [Gammaproteobacteria bacterium]|nr:glutamate racemase [Gammaproteobacteria bacterium]
MASLQFMINANPIGIFDSGIGGLSIARRIREILPNENLLYIADSAHAPYGDKSESYIYQRSSSIIEFLLERNAKAVVIACNTATVSSIKQLRANYSIPIVGVEPGVKPAAFKTRSGIIGVLATTQTLKSTSFNALANSFSTHVKIEVQPCPGLMEQVEALNLDSDITEQLIKEYVSPLLARGADNIVLGCTHYAYLEQSIKKIAGPNVEIINTDLAVAKEAARRLDNASLLTTNTVPGKDEFWSSGAPDIAQKQISQLWGETVNVLQM